MIFDDTGLVAFLFEVSFKAGYGIPRSGVGS